MPNKAEYYYIVWFKKKKKNRFLRVEAHMLALFSDLVGWPTYSDSKNLEKKKKKSRP